METGGRLPGWPDGRNVGFTIVELVVCLGIVLLVMGLLLPTLGRSRQAAVQSVQLQEIRQAHDLLTLWANENDGVYPIQGDNQLDAAMKWYIPLIASGHLTSPRELDPGSSRRGLDAPFAMSVSMCSAPDYFIPDRVEYPDETLRPVAPVRADQVLYPSGKGVLFTWRIGYVTDPFIVPWCCLGQSLAAPIAFEDGSAESLAVEDCYAAKPPRTEELAGVPVYTTWYRVRGRDR